ncbi:MAG: AzlD domain-containing protein [Hyphomicrobiales bacterium]|nr:AzlD domain-containing protein [Hyphomicrobiales bacterium]
MGEGLSAYLFLLIVGFCATAPWRIVGVALSQTIDADSEVLRWVRAVSTALIAGLVARLVFFPAGALADVPMALRLAAFAVAIVAFMLAKRSLAAGVLAGEAALLLGLSLS